MTFLIYQDFALLFFPQRNQEYSIGSWETPYQQK